METKLPLWLFIVCSGTVAGLISAGITSIVNWLIAGRIKPKADSYVTRFNATYKIREELAASILTSVMNADKVIYEMFHQTNKEIQLASALKLEEISKDMELTQAKSKIYFDKDIADYIRDLAREIEILKWTASNIAHDRAQSKSTELENVSIKLRERDAYLCEKFKKLLVA